LCVDAGHRPQDIDILVTNCSIYCPTPSLASMLVNHFKMRQDVQTYHLGGMGCGNGVMALGLIRDLLQVRPNGLACCTCIAATTAPGISSGVPCKSVCYPAIQHATPSNAAHDFVVVSCAANCCRRAPTAWQFLFPLRSPHTASILAFRKITWLQTPSLGWEVQPSCAATRPSTGAQQSTS